LYKPDQMPLGEGEMGRTVAVEVTDLLPADAKGELSALARPGFDTRPRCNRSGDSLAGRFRSDHTR
jgi:hypothetical protein